MRRKKHLHDLSTEKDFSANMGYLIPTHWRMVYPGDVVRERAEYLVRVSPLLAPIVSKVMIKIESFFVATDNVWTSAQEFYSRGQNGTSTKTVPKFNIMTPTSPGPANQAGQGSLLDFLGYKYVPLTLTINALLPRVYGAIYNWHYRDQDLQTARTVSTADGPDTTTDLTLAKRCWERDRFTTARLTPQRGDDVLIPANDADLTALQAPVKGIGKVNQTWDTTDRTVYETDGSGTTTYANAQTINPASANTTWWIEEDPGNAGYPGIYADLSGLDVDVPAAMGTIRELEEAVAINRFRTRLQTADGSYPDYTLATFGIRAPDIELQKPVLLARSSSPLQISEIVQTAANYDADDVQIGDPVGELKGHGIGVARGHGYKYHVKRHGYIMTIFSVVPKTMYDGGVDKEFLRTTPDDYFDPDLDEIGEEAIVNQEVYGLDTGPNDVFGYQYRNYCDRSSLSSVAGEMHEELDFWHQARKFDSDVALNAAFVTCDPTDRIFALGSTQDQLRVKAMHDVKILRVMRRIPKKGNL